MTIVAADVIAALHTELEFEKYESDLRGIVGIWNMLQSLRTKATTVAGVAAYRSYLERCVNKLKSDPELDEPAVGVVIHAWMDYIKGRNAELKEQIASRNPIGIENWMHKWQPLVYDDYRLALNGWLTRATKRSSERLMETTRILIDEFAKACDAS